MEPLEYCRTRLGQMSAPWAFAQATRRSLRAQMIKLISPNKSLFVQHCDDYEHLILLRRQVGNVSQKKLAELAHSGAQRSNVLVIDIIFTEGGVQMFAPEQLLEVFHEHKQKLIQAHTHHDPRIR
ncbi:hypothetical protein KIN20_009907 [Parelaphostrongylus tenuis]|uniref:Uncharacterized protein n=1 Tax=Parelaphostrongylus tenuis TaxID=148309 RepID=A0AAD5QLJ3_PARTN|nr:hypothetical protein KIN20_009907 [Parelaphostrongylus tenuis]